MSDLLCNTPAARQGPAGWAKLLAEPASHPINSHLSRAVPSFTAAVLSWVKQKHRCQTEGNALERSSGILSDASLPEPYSDLYARTLMVSVLRLQMIPVAPPLE